MPKITVMPHHKLCPQGVILEGMAGETIIQCLLRNHIEIEHACEMQCACATCHVYIRKGFNSLNPVSEREDEMLSKAWEVDLDSRLSCQAVIADEDLVIEIPRYTSHIT